MHTNRSLFLIVGFVLIGSFTLNGAKISGELKKWHKVTIQFEGPECSETGDVNPFMDYRLNVTFPGPPG